MKKLLIGCAFLLLASCTSQEDAERALGNAGYSYIQMRGHGWFMCGRADFYSTKFEAINPVGKKSVGAVCSGPFMKGATIRF